jgi:putative NADH-flavin reductase
MMVLVLLFIVYSIVLSAALAHAGHRSAIATPGRNVSPNPGRVLIIGASGGTGRQLVAQALERGYAVTALVRDPSRLRIEHERLTIVQGDVLDNASVHAAMRGQQAVLCALGHRLYFQPTRILSAGTRNILEAMEAHGVRRIVCETSLGIGDSAGRLGLYYTLFVIPVILPFYYWDKTRQERAIAASDMQWVIVRPGVLTNGARQGDARHGRDVGSFVRTVRIGRADVADFMLNQLASDANLRTAPGVGW